MSVSVTENCIAEIMRGTEVPSPCVQILSVKPIKSPQPQPSSSSERYRMSISDGTHSTTVMLATQCNQAILDGTVSANAIVQISRYIINEVRGKRIVIVLEMEVISAPLQNIIGQPIDFDHQPQQQQQQQQQHHQQQQQQQHQPPQQPPQEPYEGEDISGKPILPIKLLTPYRQSWTIKGRCTYKSPPKTYNTQSGNSGTVARVHILGEDGGEIEATLWRDALDKFYSRFEVGGVYFISKATVKQSNKRFSSLNNDYAITIEMSSVVQPAMDDGNIKVIGYKFVSIADIQGLSPETNVDVCGILMETGEAAPLKTRAGKDTFRRNVKLGDQSGAAIDLTLWGEQATGLNFDEARWQVLAIKGARVSSFNGKSLSSGFTSIIQLSPDLPQCNELKSWFDSQGQQASFNEISQGRGESGAGGGSQEPKTIAEMLAESKAAEGASYYTVKMTIALFRKEQHVSYTACKACNKKVHQVGDVWRCEPCNVEYETPEYRYILSCNASDHTGSQWISCFDEVGRQLLGVDASTLELFKGEPGYDSYFTEASFKSYKFRIRAKSEMYQDEEKMKFTVARATPMDYVQDTANLIAEINKYG